MTRAQMTYPAHARALLALGLPLVGGHIAQMAIGLTDTVMVGWYGAPELASMTLANTVFFTLFLVGSGFGWAVMPMVARFNAQGDEMMVRRATRMGLWLSCLFALVFFPMLWFSHPLLLALGQEAERALQASQYLKILAFALAPALVTMTLRSYLAALEKTRVVFWITLIGVPFNAAANYALIFGNWGFPALGLQGAAYASLMTNVFSTASVVAYIALFIPQHAMFQRVWRLDPEVFADVFRLGWPIGLTSLAETGLFAASALMMGWLGTTTLAAHGIAIQLASITFMLHVGVSNAATVRAGNAFGRDDWPHLRRGGAVALMVSALMACGTILLFLSVPDFLLGLFLDPGDPDRNAIIEIGVTLLALAALFQLVDGAQVVALGVLRGIQDTRAPMWLAGLSYWGLGLPSAYVLGIVWGFGGPGVWVGLVIGLGTAAVLLNIRFWRTVRGHG